MPAAQPRPNRVTEAPQRRGRPTFGFFVNWGLTNPYSSPLWWGAVEAAQALDVNLVGFGDINIYDMQHNRSLYWQVQPSAFDGLILVNPTFPRLPGEVFGRMPFVNIGCPMEEAITSILVDNYDGMRAVVRHMIEVHGCRRLAFIKGPANNPDSDGRCQAYVDELNFHGLAVDSQLLFQPFDWSPPGGREGVRVLLDERKIKFDALLAANDNMALAAMQEIQARGMQVPNDVLISGFDDAIESPTVTPPLTTVRQPLHKMGRLALEALLANHQGKTVPDKLIMPTTLLIRRSCGCFSEAILRVNEGLQPLKPGSVVAISPEETLAGQLLLARQDVLLGELQRAMVYRDMPEFSQHAGLWLEGLVASLDEADNGVKFLTAIDLTSRRLMDMRIPVTNLQDVLSALRRECFRILANHPILLAQAENLWHRARVFLNELALQQQTQKRVELNDQMTVLRSISQTMAVTFHLDNLMEILARDLPRLDIPGCYVAIYEGVNRPAESVRLVLAFEGKQKPSTRGRQRYPTAELLPVSLWGERRRTFVLEALEFQSEEIGFVLFEVGPHDGAVYEALRSQLGSSIKGTLLFDERDHLLTKTTQLYRQAATGQRLAEEANRLKSRFLSMVSHELRSPLSLITGLSERLLHDMESLKPPNSENLKLVHVTAHHLDNLIHDVLDLARDEKGDLRLVCEPLDLAKVLEAVVIVGEKLATENVLLWKAQIPTDLPLIWGDPTRLRQVVLNLVNNAAKFTEKGHIHLQVMLDRDMVRICVEDTGLGIPQAEQNVIFEEFRQSDRTTARGFGGLGLGLAICKRLVKMHGGEIGVTSSGVEGEGATFFFTLPTLQTISLGKDNVAAVWILTLNPDNARPLKQYLEGQGFHTEVLNWDKEGRWLERAGQTPPTAVILDIHKTRRRGLEAMRALKANPACNEVTVLFYSLQAERNSGALLEMDFLTKPIRTSELVEALQRVGWPRGTDEERDVAVAGEGSKTILIVDDEPNILALHAQIVHDQFPDFQVLLAANGKQALQLLQTNRPDLVMLDLMMPEMDGFSLLEAMKEIESTTPVPVIVISGKTLNQDAMTRLNRSVATVLHKGVFSTSETLAHIKDTLFHKQRISRDAQRLTRKAMAYIHENFSEPIGREDVARYVGVSEGYLSRCFTQETGLSLVHYLTRYRIQQAKQLLTVSDMTITSIALEVGFSDGNYFSRTFRKETGISPLAYRRTT